MQIFSLIKPTRNLQKNIEGYEDDVVEMFFNYTWPGNLREFRNVVRRAVLLTPSGKINSKVLPWEITNAVIIESRHMKHSCKIQMQEPVITKDLDLKDAAAKAEYDTIMNVFKEVNFNKTTSGRNFENRPENLYNKIKIYQSL